MSKTMWKITYDTPCPREVTAEKPCWPNFDSDGDQIYENTHFMHQDEAWDKQLRELECGVIFTGQDIKRYKEELAKAEQRAGKAAEYYAAAVAAHREYEGEKK